MQDDAALVEERLVFPPLVPEVATLHAGLKHFRSASEGVLEAPLERRVWIAFVTAVIEIGENILRHAHPEGEAGPHGLVALQLRLYANYLEASFSDRGIPFVSPTREAEVNPDLLEALPEGGFGLTLARAALDELSYSRTEEGENRWRLIKQLGST